MTCIHRFLNLPEMSSTTSGSVKVQVPPLEGPGNYQFWALRLRGILGTTTVTGTNVMAWLLTGAPVALLPALPVVPPTIIVNNAVTNQADIDAQQVLHTAEVQQHAQLAAAAMSTLIAGVPNSMLHHVSGD